MEASDTKRLRVLEAENAKLKRIVADRMLDMSAMKDLLGKRRSSQWPGDEPWAFFVDTLCLSGRRSCRIVGLSRSVQEHTPAPKDDAAVAGPMKELASENRRHG